MEDGKNKTKKNVGIIILIVLLLIVVFGLVGYIVYDKVIISTDKLDNNNASEKVTDSTNDTTSKKIDVDINSDLILNLFNVFRMSDSCYMSVNGLNNDNLVRLRLAYENIAQKNINRIECSKAGSSSEGYCGTEMSSSMFEAYSANDMVKFKEYEKQNYTNAVDGKLLRAKVRELFGNTYNVHDESFGINTTVTPTCHLMHYDASNDLYARYSCEGGGICASSTQNVKSAYKLNDELYMETEWSSEDGTKLNVTYQFKKDKENGNYFFEKATQE